mmetsp:Transcript_36406/g.76681  ORF Transcript_36406/g.76681 Transcript_36406/m.76681 type:complete len:879 (+) Transcript_36406:214-2850(+)
MMSSRIRSACAILALCHGCTSIVGEPANVTPRRTDRRREQRQRRRQEKESRIRRDSRELQSPDDSYGALPLFDWYLHSEDNTATRGSGSGSVNTITKSELLASPAPQPAPLEGAIIRGTVYNDENRNAQQDPAVPNISFAQETGVAGSVVKLFDCNTGSQIGLTRSDSEGKYQFLVPPSALPPPSSNRRGCYYIQFNVSRYILPNAKFTTPKNGETYDLLLRSGQTLSEINAGVYGTTPHPTYSELWTTWTPTSWDLGGAMPTSEPVPPSPAPYVRIPIDPITEGPTRSTDPGLLPLPGVDGLPPVVTPSAPSAPSIPSVPAAPSAPVSSPSVPTIVTLPLPTDTVAIPSNNDDAPIPDILDSDTSSAPSTSPDVVNVNVTIPETNVNESETISVPAPYNETTTGNTTALPDNEELIKPSEQYPFDTSSFENPSIDFTTGMLSLETSLQLQLDNLASEMDSNATILRFDQICGEFLNEQLRIATPPILNVECAVVDQELWMVEKEDDETKDGRERKRRRKKKSENQEEMFQTRRPDDGRYLLLLRGGSRASHNNNMSHKTQNSRVLASSSSDGSSLIATVEVTGKVETTPSVQEASDVKFQDFVVGAFNVQGYLFVQSLKEAERLDTNSTSEYFQSVGTVRGIAIGAKASENPGSTGGNASDSIFSNKGVLVAIGVGGALVLSLILLFVLKVRKKRRRSSGGGSSGNGSRQSTTSSKRRNTTAQSQQSTTATTAVPATTSSNRRKSPPTSPTHTSTTIGTHATSSPPLKQPPSSPSSPRSPSSSTSSSTPRSRRIQKEIMAPSGKLGIMVANTTNAHLGPAVHTVRPGSPMEGLVHVNDIIVAVNDVDTRMYTAEDITRVMKETVGEERKITVLTARP